MEGHIIKLGKLIIFINSFYGKPSNMRRKEFKLLHNTTKENERKVTGKEFQTIFGKEKVCRGYVLVKTW